MPNLVNALSDFVSSVDRLVQTDTKPDGLLKQMLPILVKLLPETQILVQGTLMLLRVSFALELEQRRMLLSGMMIFL